MRPTHLVMLVLMLLLVFIMYIFTSRFLAESFISIKQTNIYVVINSCRKFANISVPPLVASLAAAAVPRENIIIVIGESMASDLPMTIDGIDDAHIHMVPYSNIDNNGLMWISFDSNISDLDEKSWFVYLHDTCTVNADFWSLVRQNVDMFNEAHDVLAAPIRSYPSMNIGLYRTSSVRCDPIRDKLKPIVNYDTTPEKLLATKQDIYHGEDFVFKMLELSGKVQALQNEEPVMGQDFVYNENGQKRYTEFYKSLGVTKYKANKGQISFIELFL